MSNTNVSTNGIGLGGILFIVFLIIKLTEGMPWWGENFPRFLKSTPVWWDGWFMVFLPLWVPIALVLTILLIGLFIVWLLTLKK